MAKREWKDMTSTEKRQGIIGLVIIAIIFFVFISVVSGRDKEAAKPKATYSPALVGFSADNPATLRFSFTVKNTSQIEGKPSCKVNATDESGVYSGWDIFDMQESIVPGAEKYLTGIVTVTNQGAGWVTKVTAECS